MYSWPAEDLVLQARAPDFQDLDHALSADYIISHHPGAGDGRAKADGVAVLLVFSQHHCPKPSHSHCQQEMRHTLGKAADSNTAGQQRVSTGHSVGSHVPPSATRAGVPQGCAMQWVRRQPMAPSLKVPETQEAELFARKG